MTDEEILKRLGEIEGLLLPEEKLSANDLMFWNPLENWADLGPLIEKYDVWLPENDGCWHAWCDGCIVLDKSIHRAVCLSIIEAHK